MWRKVRQSLQNYETPISPSERESFFLQWRVKTKSKKQDRPEKKEEALDDNRSTWHSWTCWPDSGPRANTFSVLVLLRKQLSLVWFGFNSVRTWLRLEERLLLLLTLHRVWFAQDFSTSTCVLNLDFVGLCKTLELLLWSGVFSSSHSKEYDGNASWYWWNLWCYYVLPELMAVFLGLLLFLLDLAMSFPVVSLSLLWRRICFSA